MNKSSEFFAFMIVFVSTFVRNGVVLSPIFVISEESRIVNYFWSQPDIEGHSNSTCTFNSSLGLSGLYSFGSFGIGLLEIENRINLSTVHNLALIIPYGQSDNFILHYNPINLSISPFHMLLPFGVAYLASQLSFCFLHQKNFNK